MKPGYKTSEFWFTAVTFIFSGLYLTGIISDHDHKEELISNVSHAVESVILIGGQGVILYKYLRSRKVEKVEHEKTLQKEADTKNKALEEYVGMNKPLSKININRANLGELVQLPHIGVALASKIIEHRTEIGSFQNPEQLMDISGIGNDKYEDLKQYIILSTPKPKKKRNVTKRSNLSSRRSNNNTIKRVSKKPKDDSSE